MAKKSGGSGRTGAGYRSAKTGQYVTKKHAEKNPSTTVRETKPGGSKPGKKGK